MKKYKYLILLGILKKIAFVIALFLISCGDSPPTNKLSIWKPNIDNLGHLAIYQVYDDLANSSQFFGTYEVSWMHGMGGKDVKGVLYLTLPESMYDSAQKRTENGTYPIYLRDAELLLRDALTNTRYESKVYLDLTKELNP